MIQLLFQERNNAFQFWRNIYVFGSILTSYQPNDVDILLVYRVGTLEQCKVEKEKLRSILLKKFNEITVDLVLMSSSEVRQSQFLNKILIYKQIK